MCNFFPIHFELELSTVNSRLEKTERPCAGSLHWSEFLTLIMLLAKKVLVSTMKFTAKQWARSSAKLHLVQDVGV